MTEIVHDRLCARWGFTGICSCGADPDSPFACRVDESAGMRFVAMSKPYHGALNAALELFLPDELFEGVMQGMADSSWLRERAETIAAEGGPAANEKAAALFEAADALDAASASADAAP